MALPTAQVFRVHDLADDCPRVVQTAKLYIAFGQQLAPRGPTTTTTMTPHRRRHGRPLRAARRPRNASTPWKRRRIHIRSRRRRRRRRRDGSVQRRLLFAVLQTNIVGGYPATSAAVARTVRRNTAGVIFNTFVRRVNYGFTLDFHLKRSRRLCQQLKRWVSVRRATTAACELTIIIHSSSSSTLQTVTYNSKMLNNNEYDYRTATTTTLV